MNIKDIIEEITEESRQTQIVELFDEINERINSYNERVKEIAQKSSQINRNPDATEKDFEQVVQSLVQEREKLQKEIMQKRFDMVDQFTADEWKQVFSSDSTTNIE